MTETLTLTKQDLKEIITAAVTASQEGLANVVRELKKPTEMEQAALDVQRREIEAQQKQRKDNSDSIKAGIATMRAIKRQCSHEHPNGDSHCVWVQEKTGPGYLLCQKNQCIVRPGVEPEDYQGDHIYDSALFNRIFQRLNTSGADIIG